MAVHDQGAGFEAVLARAGDLSAETDYVQVWCDYVRWSAETRPPAEAGAVLTRACRTLLGNERARSDQRTLRLLVRYANMQPCPQEVFRSLEAQGVGAGQALLYEAWASCLERAHRHAEAGEVYRRGLAGKAEPQARLRTRLAEFERRARRHSAPVQQGNITFEAWWAAVGKCKGIALWKGKIETLSGGSHAVNGLTIETVGQAVFRHVDSDGEW
ncbi:unnamed protein product, partial [Prorocentrum cordatum]